MLKRLADLSRKLLSFGREPDLPALPSEEDQVIRYTTGGGRGHYT